MVVKRAVERRRGIFACCVCRTARRRLSLILSVGGLASAMRPALWLGDPRRLWPSRLARFMNLLPVATALLATAGSANHRGPITRSARESRWRACWPRRR
jgi:hypothetical protein